MSDQVLKPEEVVILGFKGILNKLGIDFQGKLKSGKEWRLVESRKKAPGLFYGLHWVIEFMDGTTADDESEETIQAIGELTVLAISIASKLSFLINPIPKSYRVETNGGGLVSRAHFHLHIICPTIHDIIFYSVLRPSFEEHAKEIIEHLNNNTKPLKPADKVQKKIDKLEQ